MKAGRIVAMIQVLACIAPMRDEYPPFRFDQGGTDPGSFPVPPTPTPTPAPGAPTRITHHSGA